LIAGQQFVLVSLGERLLNITAGPRIEHGDRVDRDHLDIDSVGHSITLKRVRALISKKRSSESKR